LQHFIIAKCEKCHEEFKFTSRDKVMVIRKDCTSRSTHESNVAAGMGEIASVVDSATWSNCSVLLAFLIDIE